MRRQGWWYMPVLTMWEVGAKKSGVQGYPLLYSEFTTSCQKQNQKNNKSEGKLFRNVRWPESWGEVSTEVSKRKEVPQRTAVCLLNCGYSSFKVSEVLMNYYSNKYSRKSSVLFDTKSWLVATLPCKSSITVLYY